MLTALAIPVVDSRFSGTRTFPGDSGPPMAFAAVTIANRIQIRTERTQERFSARFRQAFRRPEIDSAGSATL